LQIWTEFGFFNVVLPLNQWKVGAPGRASVPRAAGPTRGTESQCFSFSERFALKKFNTHPLEWLAGTLALPWPKFALGYFGSFLFFVPIPLETWKNLQRIQWVEFVLTTDSTNERRWDQKLYENISDLYPSEESVVRTGLSFDINRLSRTQVLLYKIDFLQILSTMRQINPPSLLIPDRR
jgi:hypothetical protein